MLLSLLDEISCSNLVPVKAEVAANQFYVADKMQMLSGGGTLRITGMTPTQYMSDQVHPHAAAFKSLAEKLAPLIDGTALARLPILFQRYMELLHANGEDVVRHRVTNLKR